uniref:NADH dehydrogenase subunit 6 n=1 Tax=Balta dissecta TaxID=3037035 RepID=UPI0027A0047E|nr:NADH dehydrogenase subunit 6 [Balta dissecta]WGO57155.1 NADH dehydrogenase subunit 6 [Balta dissecta]
MTKMIMFMMMLTSITFTQLNHPMTLGMMLLLQTMMISMLSGLMSQTFWFSYVLMLVFLGGMMVLFIYVTSIASNEIMQTSMKMFILMMMATTLVMSIMNPYLEMNNQETMNMMMMNTNTNESLMKLYNNPTNSITIMMASYLFITLIAVVKITSIFKGPLRKMN